MALSRRFLLSALAACFLVFVAGCETDGVGGGNPEVPKSTSTAQLRVGDSLTVVIQGVPDPTNNAVTINDAGQITLPYIGIVDAAALSTAELSQKIRDTYISKKIYTTLDVSVSVTERYIYVGGEVQHPGRIVWTPDLTVAKAVQAAGGFTLYAKETAVNLVRDNKAYLIDVKVAQRNPGDDPPLVPGDYIRVPRSPF